MASKPLIGLNTEYRAESLDRPAYSCLAAGYFDCVIEAGGIPVMLPPLMDRRDIEAAVAPLKGVVMIGGADLDPRRDGFMLHPTVKPLDPKREDFDRTLMDVLAEQRIPVLGVGTGMQLLNVSQGGNLYLHIPRRRAWSTSSSRPAGPGAPSQPRCRAGHLDGAGVWRR